jgi:hypothetical protein
MRLMPSSDLLQNPDAGIQNSGVRILNGTMPQLHRIGKGLFTRSRDARGGGLPLNRCFFLVALRLCGFARKISFDSWPPRSVEPAGFAPGSAGAADGDQCAETQRQRPVDEHPAVQPSDT